MITQVRIYTVNRGMMDSWIKVFNEQLAPASEKNGIHILGAWVNRPQNEFIWIRSADSTETFDAYYASEERKAIGDLPGTHLAKIEVRDVESVYEAKSA